MNDLLAQYFRCPKGFASIEKEARLPSSKGYFLFGSNATCYGTYFGGEASPSPNGILRDAGASARIEGGTVYLCFDPAEVIENLRCERYSTADKGANSSKLAILYYFFRPFLPVKVRKHIQKLHLRGWKKLAFPRWPVDCAVDNLFESLMLLCLRANEVERIPFIWFWPQGHSSCAIMTHDVETGLGKAFCSRLMDIDDSYGLKSSFQLIPEERYTVPQEFLDSIRQRQFEVVVHDLNHDGHLYDNREKFLERASKINFYRRKFGAEGFRAGVLYRNQMWYDALDFSFDMSVPNVAHLDPQRGGCCTVMPYFIGDLLEIPVTTTQDYSLFNILKDYSTDLWRQQTEIILEKHGIMSFIVHPDYLCTPRELAAYESLLDYLGSLRRNRGVWFATAGDVNTWWRQRAAMSLVETERGWEIEGQGKERACIAYAREEGGRIVYSFEEPSKAEMAMAVSAGQARGQ
jgi:hypothetical protein